MKKIISLLGILGTTVLLLSACGNNADKKETNYQDKQFISSLEKGLEGHWKIANKAVSDNDNSKEVFENGIKKEVTEISKYKSAQFKDSKLQELAISYINILNDQNKELDHFNSDSFYKDWTDIYGKRTEILVNINALQPLKFSSKQYESNFNDLKNDGKAVQNEVKRKEEIKNFVSSITFKPSADNDPESDYKSYSTVVENTTSFNFSSFSLNAKLIDKDDVTVDTQYVSTEDFQKGQKAKLDFQTDKSFVKTKVVQNYVAVADSESSTN